MSQKVPVDFVKRAKKHLEDTNEPLLEYRLDKYEERIYVDGSGKFTCFTASNLEYPPHTWREFMDYRGWDAGTMQEWALDNGILPEDVDDDPVAYKDWLDWQIGNPYEYFPDWETDNYGDPNEVLRNAGVGREITVIDENGRPVVSGIELVPLFSLWGHPAHDNTSLVASSKLAVSCLQYVLDEKRSGIMVEYVENPWG